MAKEKLKTLITSFTPDGDFLSIFYPGASIKIWNTSNGNMLTEWKQSASDPVSYSCMACIFIGKKRKKENHNFLLALGTNDGDILVIDALNGETKWKSSRCHPGGVAGLAFTNKGRSLYVVGANGVAFEMNSQSGELKRELRASKKPISSLAFSTEEKVLAVFSGRTRILSLETGKELLKFPDDMGPVQHMSLSNNAKMAVTSVSGGKNLQLWRCDYSSKSVTTGPVLSMRHPPLAYECKNISKEKDDNLVILAISESGIAYVWKLETISKAEVNPTKITVKGGKMETQQHKSESAKKNHALIFAARLHALDDEKELTALIAYGSPDSPQFNVVKISNSGQNIVVTTVDENTNVQENEILVGKDLNDLKSDATAASTQRKKKRAASDVDHTATSNGIDSDRGEVMNGTFIEGVNEPTMGEKLANLYLHDNDNSKNHEQQESSPLVKPPSADSVHILLKQALHADDRALLLDCLYTQDEKVIANSISQLNPSDVLKLLQFLVSILESRGAVLVCALPWLKSLLVQHASGIMSHESSLHALNSLYQLVESRVSSFQSALQLSSCLDFLFAGVVEDDVLEEQDKITPIIYEDKDESDEEEEFEEDGMETDQLESKDEEDAFEDLGDDIEGSDGMSEFF